MLRRTFFQSLLGTALIPLTTGAERPKRTLLFQESPLAGFQYHQGSRVWPALRIGDPLHLRREPENPHDQRVIALYRRGHKSGYLPRIENTAAAQLIDRGEHL